MHDCGRAKDIETPQGRIRDHAFVCIALILLRLGSNKTSSKPLQDPQLAQPHSPAFAGSDMAGPSAGLANIVEGAEEAVQEGRDGQSGQVRLPARRYRRALAEHLCDRAAAMRNAGAVRVRGPNRLLLCLLQGREGEWQRKKG